MDITQFAARHVRNPGADSNRAYGETEKQILSLAAFADAAADISSWPDYRPTPLVRLPGLAGKLGVGHVHHKDEGKRFQLKSFKALGGAYAVLKILQRHLRDRHDLTEISSRDLLTGHHLDLIRDVTVASATDGNHGRSVAWGANMFGCKCNIYLHSHVSDAREHEIARYGARIVRTNGNYDTSVRQCAADAAANNWHLVADTTAGGGDVTSPKLVMQGYTVMAQEFLDQLPQGKPLSHVFVPGGVGGIAAAVAAHLRERLGRQCPRIVVVEPGKADCIYRSVAAGELTKVPGDTETFMACLAAGEVSPLAWPILRTCIDDVLTLPDDAAREAMLILARGLADDPHVVAGESGAAATAGLIAAALDPALRKTLGLNQDSRIVTIGSEGATDADTYLRVVGKTAEQVETSA